MKRKSYNNQLDDFTEEYCPVCGKVTRFYVVLKMLKSTKIPFRKTCTKCDYLKKLTPEGSDNLLVDDN